jgi:hypothetical protein
MAVEKNIVIGADLSGLETKLGELIDLLKTSQEQANKTAEQLDEINGKVDNIGKNSKSSTKSVGGLAKGFKGMGVAIKAAGIGLLLSAMGMLKELFDNNQKTVDFFNTAFNSLQIAFSDFAKWVESNIGTFTGFFKDIFENPKERMLELGRALKEGVIARFEQLLEVFGYVGRALLAVVKGDFTGAMNAIKEAGKQSADVITGVDGSFEAVKETIKNTAKAVANYTKETVKQGQAMTETNKQAEIAEVLAQGLIEKYDLQAERLRQVRDDERFTIEERIKANNELKGVLEEQENAMLENAQRIVDAKARQLSLDKDNIEFQKEYLAAQNELVGVQAQVAGFRSEQLMNDMALQRELFDLEVSRKENEQEVAEIQAEAAIEAETNLYKQLENEELLNQQLYEKRLESLELQKGLYVEGTQAYQDMVSEINVLNAERTAQEGEEARKRTDLEKELQQAKMQMASDVLGGINDLAQAFLGADEENAEKAFNINKKLGIAQAVINTSQAITAALATANPIPGGRFVEAGIAAASGLAQIMSIRNQKFESPDTTTPDVPSGAEAMSSASAPRTPNFNVVGQSGTNALLESLQKKPMKAYVVGGEVTNQQQLDRKKVQTSSFG